MSIQSLRDKALAHNMNQRFTYPVCLDEDLRTRIDQASQELDKARERLSETNQQLASETKPSSRKIADNPRGMLQKDVIDKENILTELEASIPEDEVLVLNFRRLTPDHYQDLQDGRIGEKGQLDLPGFYRDLAAECWLIPTSIKGELVGLTWDEVRNETLSPTDLSYIHVGLVGLHQRVGRIPLNLQSSGMPAMS